MSVSTELRLIAKVSTRRRGGGEGAATCIGLTRMDVRSAYAARPAHSLHSPFSDHAARACTVLLHAVARQRTHSAPALHLQRLLWISHTSLATHTFPPRHTVLPGRPLGVQQAPPAGGDGRQEQGRPVRQALQGSPPQHAAEERPRQPGLSPQELIFSRCDILQATAL